MHFTLKQGVELDVIKTNQFKTNHVLINFSTNQNAKTITSRSLLANLLETSTHKYPTQTALARQLSALFGAYAGAGVGRVGNLHTIKFRASFINDRYAQTDLLDSVLDVLKEMIYNPLIDNRSFDLPTFNLQKANLQSAINSLTDDKQFYALQQLKQAYFADNSSQIVPSFGQVTDLASISAESLVQTYHEMVNNDQINIVVLGDVDEAKVVKLLEAFPFTDRETLEVPVRYTQSIREKVIERTEHQELNQSKLNLAYQLPVYYHDDHYMTSLVMNGIFGSLPLSKLFVNVREKASLAYYANSQHSAFNGLLSVQTGIDGRNREQAQKLIERQLSDVQNGDFEDHLLEEVKASLVNQFQSGLDVANNIVSRSLLNSLTKSYVSDEELVDGINSVTKNQVMDLARQMTLQATYFLNGEI